MSMRIKAALVIMAIVFAFTVASFFLSTSFTQYHMTDTIEQELSFALDIANTLVAAKISLLKSNAETAAARLNALSESDMANVMAEQLEEFDEFVSLTVYGRSGMVVSCGNPVDHDVFLTEREYMLPAFDGESILSSAHYSGPDGDFVIHVFVPMDAGSILSATIPGMFFSDILSEFRLWQSGSIFMVDMEGTIIASYRDDLVLDQRNLIQDAKTDRELESAGRFFSEMTSNGGRGSGRYTFEGSERLCVYSRVYDSVAGWYISVTAPLSETPLYSLQKGLLLSTLMFIAIGVVFSVFVSRVAVKPYRTVQTQMEEIARRDKLLTTGNSTAETLLSTDDGINIKSSIMAALELVGQSLDVDRVQIWRNEIVNGKLNFVHEHQWLSEAGERSTPVPIGLKFPYSEKPEWERTFRRGECINGPLSELPPEDQAFLNAYDMKTIVIIPLFLRDMFWGFFSIDDCRRERCFTDDEISILRSISLMMVNAFSRSDMLSNLQDASTKLEEALDGAKKANEAKSSFLANMSHEMRTPLNAIIGLTELILGSEKKHRECGSHYNDLEKIYNAGKVLLSTVNDILDISKIEAGKFELVPTEYDIPSLINDIVTQSIMYKGEKPIQLVLSIEENLPSRLFGDELRVKQILNNLLSNAVKYTKEGTVGLSVSCSHPAPNGTVWMTASVSDTGIGIQPEYLESIFDDYQRTDIQANRKIMGTGLGLSITKRLVGLMDGSITVESEYGSGSVFTVKLMQRSVGFSVIGPETANNLRNFHYYYQKRVEDAELVRIKLPYARVLIVDDMETNLDVAKGLMRPYGMQIDCVTSGRQAVDCIRDEQVRYNAVFMDHMMPGMDGIEATKLIRGIGTEYAKKIPIIAFTANAVTGNEEMLLRSGFQAFISKPIEIARLDSVIRLWVRDREQERLFIEKEEAPNNESSGIDIMDMVNIAKLIDGLEITEGMDRFGGDEGTYLGVLRSFVHNTPPLIETLRNVTLDNLTDYAVTVHGIKGTTLGIYATSIGDTAEALEKAAKAGDFDFIARNNPGFIDEVEKLVADLGKIIELMDSENPKPKKNKPDKDVLARLLKACENYDMDGADTAVAELGRYEYTEDRGLAMWLMENASCTNFAEIIDRLSNAG